MDKSSKESEIENMERRIKLQEEIAWSSYSKYREDAERLNKLVDDLSILKKLSKA